GERDDTIGAERSPVDILVALETGDRVGSGGGALVVDDLRARLVEHAPAGGANRGAEVGVLVVGGRVALVETAELAPEVGVNQQAGGRAVVDLAHEAEPRVGRVFAAPVVPAGAVREDDRSRLLEPAVRIDQLGADGADRLVA